MLHASVEIVNPAGTGRPAFVISARPAPLPPSVSFIVRLPSALPFPKKYTNFFADVFAPLAFVVVAFAFFFAITFSTPTFPLPVRFQTHLLTEGLVLPAGAATAAAHRAA